MPESGRFPLPNGVFARALPEQQRAPTVDAFNVTVQHQLTPTLSAEVGHVRQPATQPFAGARLLADDASVFKHVPLGDGRDIELRLEAVNIFNHVNLGNPDGEIGVPGNPNPNAGRITSTAYGNADPMRNFQFAVKFRF